MGTANCIISIQYEPHDALFNFILFQHLTSTCFEQSYCTSSGGRVETESGGTRRSTGEEVKGKEANGVSSQQSCTVSEHGLSSITTADAHTSAASSRLN